MSLIATTAEDLAQVKESRQSGTAVRKVENVSGSVVVTDSVTATATTDFVFTWGDSAWGEAEWGATNVD